MWSSDCGIEEELRSTTNLTNHTNEFIRGVEGGIELLALSVCRPLHDTERSTALALRVAANGIVC